MADATSPGTDGSGLALNRPRASYHRPMPEHPSDPINSPAGGTPGHGNGDGSADWSSLIDQNGRLPKVPLFPLPNVVLLPGAVLPLHVFEKRYRVMTADALGLEGEEDGRGLICMCRIRPGHNPMDDQPAIFPTACVGRIVHHEQLADGRCNLLLLGLARVQVGAECLLGDCHDDAKPYRRADLQVLPCTRAYEIDLGEAREKMKSLCRRPPIAGTPVAHQLEKLFCGSTPTARLADVLAFDLLEDVDQRQQLLEELDERRRVELLARMLDEQFPDPASTACFDDRFADD